MTLHAKKCRCGWILPLSVMPLDAESENIATGVFVGLFCPICKEPHAFFNANDPELVKLATIRNMKTAKKIQ